MVVYVIVCTPAPAATGSKSYVLSILSVTPAPLYTPPVGVAPPSPACTPESIHRSARAVNVTDGKPFTKIKSSTLSEHPISSVNV